MDRKGNFHVKIGKSDNFFYYKNTQIFFCANNDNVTLNGHQWPSKLWLLQVQNKTCNIFMSTTVFF